MPRVNATRRIANTTTTTWGSERNHAGRPTLSAGGTPGRPSSIEGVSIQGLERQTIVINETSAVDEPLGLPNRAGFA